MKINEMISLLQKMQLKQPELELELELTSGLLATFCVEIFSKEDLEPTE